MVTCTLVYLILLFFHTCRTQEDSTLLSTVEPCNPGESILDAVTHKFRSNCGPRQWCKPTTTFDHDPVLGVPTVHPQKRDQSPFPSSPSSAEEALATATTIALDFGLCVDKQCRRDEYPFGYRGVPFEELPPRCSTEEYCPDDESQCVPLIPLGLPCLLNRDDSCRKKEDSPFETLCLQGLCRLASVLVDEICMVDSAAYLGYNESGSQVIATVTRDNCQTSLYCNESTSRCTLEKVIGLPCLENRECITFNCHNDLKTCQKAPELLHHLPLWSWILIGMTIVLALIGLVFALYKVHLRHRASRSEEIDQFFSQQWQYRHSILSMHAAAAMASTTRKSHLLSSQTSDLRRESSYRTHYIVSKEREDDLNKEEQEQAWASSLDIKKGSPTSPSLRHSSVTLSPRLCHRRTSSS